ncbi:hypothetical protein RJ492_004224 [Pluralibacter gergoviae]|uniref:Uncharacterized protein n=1 Tax=Pluralibacter gergoviae TaxID=61647 RepID=A0AAI9DKF2_PLUGE|nr:hypothetical protein [Pluralibacter gergoviae]EKV0916993.1 hypothetical protein [Pluralibacter gergoviae]EKV9910927.1 hypothetical protein [Pluralibacter gergoviae]EKW7277388.1 hypothetical protein [Pluralibacter gergoviae]ELD4297510.1 hypothetical protein [Pluralibacter gergoviae]ELD4308257.1 hypothetical protein [Pluralibacter gergoviae]
MRFTIISGKADQPPPQSSCDFYAHGGAYAFQASKVKQQYWEQTAQGGKGAESTAGWNIKENKEA